MSEQKTRARLTTGRVNDFVCPQSKSQAFLWDTETPTLALRVTPTGRRTYVFESRLNGGTIRISIGTAPDWSIDQARKEAMRLKVMIDSGQDPRAIAREEKAKLEALTAQELLRTTTVREAWDEYLVARRPHWGERHYVDHTNLARQGGVLIKRGTRGKGITSSGPLHALMNLELRNLDAKTIEAWAATESQTRPTAARLAWRCLKAFLNWCAEHPDFSNVTPERNPAKTKKAREALGKPSVKSDALLREQLPAWFEAVGQLSAAPSAYLQILLLTGARPGEILELRWEDVDLRWRTLTIRDKVEGDRVIPLTPHTQRLITGLPNKGLYVFAGSGTQRDEPKPMVKPNVAHSRACARVGLPHITLHGLRRSFKSLTEWLDIPAGVVAQIMGHKPSATAEKHYTVRPLDLLRVHHERIESWILEQGKVTGTNPS
ncbi:MAG: DUF4102 domain-containing protein [Curvibacter sp.]|uniref:tyrosine-type recombinase/integrase n=1 Tax=Curvibacter lanceolatus TaxID=86182 RepID=UPI0003A091E2|nr:integrase family protein [Curvibacter lanceolatus]RUP32170.1 MAG: DUF4102 domain-containing protein [Curvibacter sp.]